MVLDGHCSIHTSSVLSMLHACSVILIYMAYIPKKKIELVPKTMITAMYCHEVTLAYMAMLHQLYDFLSLAPVFFAICDLNAVLPPIT
jgi:hypothetical protein